jgi:hypothetical protein
MTKVVNQSRPDGRAMTDLTQIKVEDLLDLLKQDNPNQIALDAAELVVPLILEQAEGFFTMHDDGRYRSDALAVAATFVQHREYGKGLTPGDMERVAVRLTRLHRAIAPPTTTDLEPVEIERTARREDEHMRAPGNGGREASHG